MRVLHVVRTRVLLAALSRLAREMVERTLDEQPDMAVVGVAESPAELDTAMRLASPDVVIVGLGGSFRVDCRNVLRRPGVRVITVDELSGQSFVCEQVGTDMAFQDVVKAIRSAAARPPLLGRTPA